MGSFEAWDDLVRSCVVWAVDADPAAGRERVRLEADPNLELMGNLFAAWNEAVPGEDWTTLRELVSGSQPEDPVQLALMAIAIKGTEPDLTKIGNRLKRWEGKIADGLMEEALGAQLARERPIPMDEAEDLSVGVIIQFTF